MKGFTDIHTHLLPGVDDGAEDMFQSLSLLRMAYENGTRTVILTPHYRGRYKKNTPQMLREKFYQLQEMVNGEMPDMKLYLGQEIAYEYDVPEAMYSGRAMTINDSCYALLEFRSKALRSQLITGVSEIVRCGFTPIVAHVERYGICRKNPTLINELLDMGALLQLNADSVMGANGFAVKRFCHKLLQAEKVHFIASDAHDDTHRPPLLRECFLHVHKKYGAQYAAELFYDNAQAVIENRTVD